MEQTVIDSEAQMVDAAKWAIEQYQHKNYMPAIGLLVMVLVFLSRKFLSDKIQPEHMPAFSAAMGILVSVATNLTAVAVGSTPIDWISAVVSGLVTGTMASGLWSLGGKKLLTKPEA